MLVDNTRLGPCRAVDAVLCRRRRRRKLGPDRPKTLGAESNDRAAVGDRRRTRARIAHAILWVTVAWCGAFSVAAAVRYCTADADSQPQLPFVIALTVLAAFVVCIVCIWCILPSLRHAVATNLGGAGFVLAGMVGVALLVVALATAPESSHAVGGDALRVAAQIFASLLVTASFAVFLLTSYLGELVVHAGGFRTPYYRRPPPSIRESATRNS